MNEFPQITWTQLVLTPRYFSWRIRGNSMVWAISEKAALNQDFDLILATSMVDLSSLIGMAPNLANIPSILYFHENQYAYPQTSTQHKSIEPLMVSLYSALSATRLTFNSRYNLESFLSGVEGLLKRFPDLVPKGIVDTLRDKSDVLPVPIERECFAKRISYQDVNGIDSLHTLEPGPDVDSASNYDAPKDVLKEAHKEVLKGRSRSGFEDSRKGDLQSNFSQKILTAFASKAVPVNETTLDIIWNHRWEYDKGPDRLLALIRSLDSSLPVRFHIVGQSFRQSPKVFDEIHELLQEKNALGSWGYIQCINEYRALLRNSDVALSTAIHDFQGLSVIEATAAGCLPLVPDRLAYKELFPSHCRYASEYFDQQKCVSDSFENETRACLERIQFFCSMLMTSEVCLPAFDHSLTLPDLRSLSWPALRPEYQAIIDE